MLVIFLPKEKEKNGRGGGEIFGRPCGHNFGHPLDRKQTLFQVWPNQLIEGYDVAEWRRAGEVGLTL